MMINKDQVKDSFSRDGILIDDKKAELLSLLANKTLEVNEYMNLTGIKDEATFISKMLIDSAITARFLNFSESRILDLGTGGGFPGLVLAILYPNSQFVLLDSTQKKIRHCEQMVDLLGLENVSCIADRAENYSKSRPRETFDYVIARAVTDLKTLVRYSVPFLKNNGRLIAYKGLSYQDEIKDAKRAFSLTHTNVIYVNRYGLSDFPSEQRYIIQIAKKSE